MPRAAARPRRRSPKATSFSNHAVSARSFRRYGACSSSSRFRGSHMDARTWGRRATERIASILTHRRLPLTLGVLAPLLLLPALGAGWQFDDYFHRSRILGYG